MSAINPLRSITRVRYTPEGILVVLRADPIIKYLFGTRLQGHLCPLLSHKILRIAVAILAVLLIPWRPNLLPDPGPKQILYYRVSPKRAHHQNDEKFLI